MNSGQNKEYFSDDICAFFLLFLVVFFHLNLMIDVFTCEIIHVLVVFMLFLPVWYYFKIVLNK